MTAASLAGLDADFAVERGGFRLGIELRVPTAGVTAIVGPNGAGKSTALGVLAGLVLPLTGRVTLADRTLDDTSSGVHVEARARTIGMVFQDYLLFPHLTALENIAFGLRTRGVSRADAGARAHELLEQFGLEAVANSRPSRLSGGQAQRVAVARALAIRPALLLLDEPLAALDAEVRPQLRADLLRAVRAFGGSTVLVTHDAVDAMTLADEIIVLEAGAVTHRCPPSELARVARTAFAAQLVGLNFLRAPDGSTETFAPDSVRVFSRANQSERAEACVVTAVELAPTGIRVQLERSSRSGLFWAWVDPRDLNAYVPRMGDRVWAERGLTTG